VLTVGQVGWAGASDATLLRRAVESFDVLLTVDRRLAQVRDALGLPIPIVVLVAMRNDFETLKPLMPEVLRRLPLLRPGQVMGVAP
jgi:hypothetical protein